MRIFLVLVLLALGGAPAATGGVECNTNGPLVHPKNPSPSKEEAARDPAAAINGMMYRSGEPRRYVTDAEIAARNAEAAATGKKFRYWPCRWVSEEDMQPPKRIVTDDEIDGNPIYQTIRDFNRHLMERPGPQWRSKDDPQSKIDQAGLEILMARARSKATPEQVQQFEDWQKSP